MLEKERIARLARGLVVAAVAVVLVVGGALGADALVRSSSPGSLDAAPANGTSLGREPTETPEPSEAPDASEAPEPSEAPEALETSEPTEASEASTEGVDADEDADEDANEDANEDADDDADDDDDHTATTAVTRATSGHHDDEDSHDGDERD